MTDRDKQFIAFHDGQEVEVPGEFKSSRPIDVPYITRNNETLLEAAEYTEALNAAEHPESQEEPKSKAATDSYVTKKFMITCMVIAIIVSTLLGAGISMSLGGGGGSKAHDNLSESDLAAATGSKLTVAEIVAKNADAVVEIVVESTGIGIWGQTTLQQGAGSGVIVNADGYIVTNYHVIEGAKTVTVTLHNGDEYKASIIGGDDASDLAVLKINAKNLTVATMGDSDKVVVGDLAVAIGNPLGQLGGTATSGIVSALDRELTIENRTLTLMQTDAAVNPGNSGGGLFNGAGQLIGIVESKTSATGIEGLAFAIPINSVKDEIDQLITDGKVQGKPSIGISITDVSESNAQYYNLSEPGVYIAQVTGENAEKAGFKAGDKIVSLNGDKIANSDDLIKKVRACKIGDTVTVVVMRSGQEIKIKTKLEDSTTAANSAKNQEAQQEQEQQQQPEDPFGFGW